MKDCSGDQRDDKGLDSLKLDRVLSLKFFQTK